VELQEFVRKSGSKSGDFLLTKVQWVIFGHFLGVVSGKTEGCEKFLGPESGSVGLELWGQESL
jgi:hypothetical protein